MRLIDADALKEELLSWARVISDPRLMATDDAMCVIDHAPTVAASPCVCMNIPVFPDSSENPNS